MVRIINIFQCLSKKSVPRSEFDLEMPHASLARRNAISEPPVTVRKHRDSLLLIKQKQDLARTFPHRDSVRLLRDSPSTEHLHNSLFAEPLVKSDSLALVSECTDTVRQSNI